MIGIKDQHDFDHALKCCTLDTLVLNLSVTSSVGLILMYIVRKLASYSLLLILFLSSLGLPVFTHVCNGMDKTWTSILVPPSNCCSHEGIKKGNCEVPINSIEDCQLSKAPCCENGVTFAALYSKYTSLSQSLVTFLLIPVFPSTFYEVTGSYLSCIQDLKFYVSCDIPHPYGRSLLIFEQLFLC